MEITEDIDPESIHPWQEIDVAYPFQEAAWQNEETAHILAVEQEQGPHSDVMGYDVLLLPPDHDENPEILAEIETGLADASRAIHEAEALMVTGTVMDHADQ